LSSCSISRRALPPRRRLRNGDGNGDGMRTEMRTGWGQVHTNRQVMHACKARTAPAACMYALGTGHACRQSIVTCYAPPSIYMPRTIGGTVLHLMWPCQKNAKHQSEMFSAYDGCALPFSPLRMFS